MAQPAFTVSAIILAAKNRASGIWDTVVADVAKAEQALEAALGPAVHDFLAAEVAVAKQYASDTISTADGWLASHAAIIAQAVETAIDTELAAATRGASTGFNKLTNQGVDELVNAAIAAAHNMGLAIKAKLAASAAPAAPAKLTTIPLPPVGGQNA